MHKQISTSLLVSSVLLLISGCKPHIDGHLDGEMGVRVEVIVRDRITRAPLSAASVTFVTRLGESVLRYDAELRAHGKEPPAHHPPIGVTVYTDDHGVAVVPCRFDAAFLTSGGPSNVVKSEWRPGGFLEVRSEGFAPLKRQLNEIYPSPPYEGAKAPYQAVFELVKSN